MFSSMGMTDGKAAEMSRSMVQLATDLASFNNTSTEDAITAIGAALRGESEPIRRYGVLLDEATLKAQAFGKGLYSGKGNLDPVTKALSAYDEILRQTVLAQGDFARTSDGLANSLKIQQAAFEDAKASIGESLLPAATGATQWLAEAMQAFKMVGFSGFGIGGNSDPSKEMARRLAEEWKAASDAAEEAGGKINAVTFGIEESAKEMEKAAKTVADAMKSFDSVNERIRDQGFDTMSDSEKLKELNKREAELRAGFNDAIKITMPDATVDQIAEQVKMFPGSDAAETMDILTKIKELEFLRNEIKNSIISDGLIPEMPEAGTAMPWESTATEVNDYQRRGLSLNGTMSGVEDKSVTLLAQVRDILDRMSKQPRSTTW
jgi:methyl-accepting chemotaxis protein